MSDQKPMEKIIAWCDEALVGRTFVSIPELRDSAVTWLLTQPETLRAYLDQSISPLVYDALQRHLAGTRRPVEVVDERADRGDSQGGRPARKSKYDDWLEWDGDKHIRFPEMMKRDLVKASDIRERRGVHELEIAALERELAKGMNDVQAVREVYTSAQIEAIEAVLSIRWRSRREGQRLVKSQEAAD